MTKRVGSEKNFTTAIFISLRTWDSFSCEICNIYSMVKITYTICKQKIVVIQNIYICATLHYLAFRFKVASTQLSLTYQLRTEVFFLFLHILNEIL